MQLRAVYPSGSTYLEHAVRVLQTTERPVFEVHSSVLPEEDHEVIARFQTPVANSNLQFITDDNG